MNKILYNRASGVIFHQGAKYILSHKNVEVKDQLDNLLFIYGTLNQVCCTSTEIDNTIEDFKSGKYIYKDGDIEINPEYVEE